MPGPPRLILPKFCLLVAGTGGTNVCSGLKAPNMQEDAAVLSNNQVVFSVNWLVATFTLEIQPKDLF